MALPAFVLYAKACMGSLSVLAPLRLVLEAAGMPDPPYPLPALFDALHPHLVQALDSYWLRLALLA